MAKHIAVKAILVFMGFTIGLFILPLSLSSLAESTSDQPFVVGLQMGPGKLDPLDALDTVSMNTIRQVCEGLYRYNYSSSEMEPIPCLAKSLGVWDPSIKNLTIALKQGVTFHDGSKFNASAVKWTFDRLQYWTYGFDIDGDGDLESHPLGTATKSYFKQGEDVILNKTVILDEYTIRFVLNFPTIIWEKLLAFLACAIVLPDPDYEYGATFFNRIDINDELIGTGPFILTEYSFDNEVVFDYYPGYHVPWVTNHIRKMIYSIIPNQSTFSQAVLNHEIHWGGVSLQYQALFDSDPYLITQKYKREVMYYIQMSLYNMPLEVRLATSFIWNHSYFLYGLQGGQHYELHVPIPDGMQYHHEGFSGEPSCDIEYAQNIILNAIDSGLTANVSARGLTPSSTTAQWRAIAESSMPIAWYNFTWYQSTYIAAVAELLQDCLKNIGIRLEISDPIGYSEWVIDYIQNPTGYRRLTYSFGGWTPVINDPIYAIEPLYGTNASYNCFGLENVTWNQMLIDTYTLSGNDRRDKFYEIQEDFVRYQAPSVYIMQLGGKNSFNRAYVDETSVGDMRNLFGHWYWFNVRFTPRVERPELDPIIPNPDEDGNIMLNWKDVPEAEIYTIYRLTTPIITLNSSIPAIGTSILSEYLDNSSLPEGTYYYVIIANSSQGDSIPSNCESVVVDRSDTPKIPGYPLLYLVACCIIVLLGVYIGRKEKDFGFESNRR